MHFQVLAARITELKQRARWNSLESMVAVGSNLIATCSLVMSIIFIIWVMVISVMWVTWYSLLEGPKEMAWNTGEVWCDHLFIILLDSNSLLACWILNTTSPRHSGLHTLQEPKKKKKVFLFAIAATLPNDALLWLPFFCWFNGLSILLIPSRLLVRDPALRF